MTEISFFHPCNPPKSTAQQRRHNRSGQSFLPPGTAKAAATLRAIMERFAPKGPFRGPVEVTLYWTWEIPAKRKEAANPVKIGAFPKVTRPDLDNLAKLAIDAMTVSGFWKDDSQVARLITQKWYGDMPGIAVSVKEMES